jgi:hypothetical protein
MVVFQNDTVLDSRPARVCSESRPDPAECRLTSSRVEMVDSLRLSRSESFAQLLRSVFLRAIGSSPAAFRERLTRYRRLLLHARDAVTAGRAFDRKELRRFTRELEDQLIWWELMPGSQASPEIELGDLELLTGIIERLGQSPAERDPKLLRLRGMLADEAPTLVFTAHRATVQHIREGLSDLRIAWCTGDRAGIGPHPVVRRSVLGWFRTSQTSRHAPMHLVVTDVAAEGLDLQRVGRVIHYDLPWTPMRIEQREGRAVRYGSLHSRVEVVRFGLPPELELRLGVNATLKGKERLPAVAGLGASGRKIWRWRSELANRFEGVTGTEGVAAVVDPGIPFGLLAGFSLHAAGTRQPLGTSVLWIDQQGRWNEHPEIIERMLQRAAAHHTMEPVDTDRLNQQLPVLAQAVRQRLSLVRGRRWLLPQAEADVAGALAQLQTLVAKAARRHDHRALAELERAIGFVAGGHTAGEAVLVSRLVRASGSEVADLLKSLPSGSSPVEQVEVKLVGLILFSPAKTFAAPVASSECQASRPRCSISTEP